MNIIIQKIMQIYNHMLLTLIEMYEKGLKLAFRIISFDVQIEI